jgi:fibronectin type 3 domain-containing protein
MNLSSSGVITGTSATSGAYTFTVHLVDSSPTPKTVTSGSLTLTVRPLPPTNLIVGPGGPSAAILTWTPSNSADVAGYKVYRGTSSGNYTTVISAGNVIGYTDTPGSGSWYYVVSAVSSLGVESVVSNEVHINVP